MTTIIFLCIAGFFAALVDSIAGGGGLISLPAFLMCNVPAHIALGTNKFSSTTASFTSSIKFALSKKVNFKLISRLMPFTLIGSIFGVKLALVMNQDFLSSIVSALVLFVGIYTLVIKNIGEDNNFKELNFQNLIIGSLFALTIGFYDGFFGPGTGSFLIFGLINIFKFDFVNASGNAKFLNFLSNLTSLVLFALNGKINYCIGIPVAITMIFGAQLGTKLALNKGSKFIKPIFVIMSISISIKLIYSNFF